MHIGTTDGAQVGDDRRPISAADPKTSSVYPNGTGETLSVLIGIVPVEPGDSERVLHHAERGPCGRHDRSDPRTREELRLADLSSRLCLEKTKKPRIVVSGFAAGAAT